MTVTKLDHSTKLPARFEDLVRVMAPQAIMNDVDYTNSTHMIDRLMASGKLSRGQELYLETLVQLVQAYESAHHPVQSRRGIPALKHLLSDNDMSASDLARLLGVHTSMGSKLLKRERALTIDHLKHLSTRFNVSHDTFID